MRSLFTFSRHPFPEVEASNEEDAVSVVRTDGVVDEAQPTRPRRPSWPRIVRFSHFSLALHANASARIPVDNSVNIFPLPGYHQV